MPTQAQIDPTRTTTLRDRFASAMRTRFYDLAGVVREAVSVDDVFGIREIFSNIESPGRLAWAARTDPAKIEEFQRWLRRGIDDEIFALVLGPGGPATRWTDGYIRSAYQAGIRRASTEARRIRGLDVDFDAPDATPFGAVFNAPVHISRAESLYTLAWTDLTKITDDMAADMSSVLTRGLIEGRGAVEVAASLRKVITGKGGDLSLVDSMGRRVSSVRRARLLARTSVIRAYHLGNVQELRNLGVGRVKVKAEWATAGDHRVCPLCIDMEGRVFTLDEIEGLIPLHPLCRCVAIPTRLPVAA